MLLYPRPRSSPRGIPRGGARSEWPTSSGPRAGYSSICHATGLGILPGRFRKSFRNPKNPKNPRKPKEHVVKTMLFAKCDRILMILGIRKIRKIQENIEKML